MRAGASLRARLWLGAVLWTVGLFAVGGFVMTQIIYSHPSAPRIFHGAFMHGPVIFVIAVASMAGGVWQVRQGVRALERLRGELGGIHAGTVPTIGGIYPAEVQPLVRDLNVLLEHRRHAVLRAQARAGDLAHGLKTPLAVLAHEAQRLSAAGQAAPAAAIGEQVERMRQQMDYHLAHARAAAGSAAPGVHAAVLPSAEGLIRALRRLHADRGLRLQVAVDAAHMVRCQREDLEDMLGNLLDNACRHARTLVRASSAAHERTIAILIDDDGAGLDDTLRERVMQRGVRADERGSGLGLAIVRDLTELYGGTIQLEGSPLGGLRARLELPAAAPEP